MNTLVAALALVSLGFGPPNAKRVSAAPQLGLSPAVNPKKLGTATLAPTALRIVTKPKLRFRAKPLVDSNGRTVDPNSTVSIPGGRAKASDLMDGTNALEAQLNDLGYSIYENENDAETPIVPVRPVTADFNAQATELRRTGGMNGVAMPPARLNVELKVKDAKEKPVDHKSNNVQPKVVDDSITLFKKSFGDKDWFAVDFDSDVQRHGDMKERKLTARADVKATLIGKSLTIFHAKAEVGGNKDLNASMNLGPGKPTPQGPSTPTAPGKDGNAGKKGKGKRGGQLARPAPVPVQPKTAPKAQTGQGVRKRKKGKGDLLESGSSSFCATGTPSGFMTLEARLLGDDLFPPVSKSTSGTAKRNLASKPMNWEYSVHIPIIPAVNAVGTIGAKGTFNLDVVLNADSLGGDIHVVPNFKASIYAQVGIEVNLFVASVEGGLGANLTLIDYKLDISSGISAAIVEKKGKSYYAVVRPTEVRQTLNTLKGNLYGYAKVGYWVPFKTHEKMLWKGDLFAWSGFTDSRTLYSDDPEPVIIGDSAMKVMKLNP